MEFSSADKVREENHKALLAALAMDNPTPQTRARRAMFVLVIAAAIVNVLAAPLIQVLENQAGGNSGILLVILPLLVGILCGEVGAMACWLVWSEGRCWHRLIIHGAIGAALILCYLCGWILATFASWESGSWIFYEATLIGCGLPAVSLAVQIPLWPFRTHFCWHVVPADVETKTGRQPLSIADILLGTAVVAVSLGLIRMSPAGSNQFVMMQMMVMGLALAVVSLVVLVPATFLVLRVASLTMGIVVYLGAVFLSECGFIVIGSVISNDWPPVEFIFAILWGSVVLVATAAAPLFVWRACGYRLKRTRER